MREIINKVNQENQHIPETQAIQERGQLRKQKNHKESMKQKKEKKTQDRNRFSSSFSSCSSSSSSRFSHSYKVEETEESSTRGFDRSSLGTKGFAGPSERGGGHTGGAFSFPARGRG